MEDRDDDEQSELSSMQIASRALDAIWVDTWSSISWKGHIRVTLGEEFSKGGNRPRLSFVMDLDEAENFAIWLFGSVSKRKLKDAAKAASEEQPEKKVE